MKAKRMTTAETLEAIRIASGWSKARMAEALGISGDNYSHILSGRRKMGMKLARRAYSLGVPGYTILGGE